MYSPAEDSIFFSEFLSKYFKKKKNKEISYLDMGTGSGILSETALKAGIKKENILAVDIDNEALSCVKKKGFQVSKSDFFSKIRTKKFDIITFNAPYLKDHKYDKKKDTSGGKNGDEASIKFIEQAQKHVKKDGKIFLLISSLTPLERIKQIHPKIVAKKKLFFEELLILEFR
jgi:release factor glutamine methyltransferase